VIGSFFAVTSIQCVLLALRAPPAAIACAALLAGFAFSYGTVVWDTTLQSTIARDKLSRVSAYNWMGAMIFLPAGYAIAGPVAERIGISASLWIGAAWIVLSTTAVLSVPGVRNVRSYAASSEERRAPPSAEPPASPRSIPEAGAPESAT
jgi:predicted MFS family arabinose efflux permease